MITIVMFILRRILYGKYLEVFQVLLRDVLPVDRSGIGAKNTP